MYMSRNCRMVCRDHGEFLETPTNHLNGNICPTCTALSDFLLAAKEKNGDRFLYSGVRFPGPSVRQKIEIHCTEHDKTFRQRPKDHLEGKAGCPDCREWQRLAEIEARRLAKKPDVLSWFNGKATKLHKGKYKYPNLDLELEAKSSIITIKCDCDNHPVFKQMASVHLSEGERGAAGCQKCKGLANRERYRTPYPLMVESMKSWGFAVTSPEAEYVNMRTAVAATCNFNHDVRIVPQKIAAGNGCSECNQGLGEAVTRSVLTTRFGEEFKKRQFHRADHEEWIAPYSRLEMDGYALGRNVGFEYQGAWHYMREMHRSDESFKAQQDRDEKKRLLFIHLEIPVFFVEEFAHPLTAEDVRDKINAAMDRAGFDPAIRIDQINLKDHLPLLKGEILERLRALEEKQQVKVLDMAWRGDWAVYNWRCGLCGKHFTAPFATRQRAKGVGCPTCVRQHRELASRIQATRLARHGDSYIQKLQEKAKGLGLLLLDTEWRGSDSKATYRFQCTHDPQQEVELSYNNLQKRSLRCTCAVHKTIMANFRRNRWHMQVQTLSFF